MDMPSADIGYIAERLPPLVDTLIDNWDDSNSAADGPVSPVLLCDAIEQLLVVLRGHEQSLQEQDEEFRLQDKELAEMVSYGTELLSEAAALAEAQDLQAAAEGFEGLTVALALWGARHGVELARLDPVVNGLARLANQLREPQVMIQLYDVMDVIAQATSPRLAQADMSDQRQPWRILLLNRAIVATRSHRPQLMEPAFDAIVEWLPDEAMRFFAEGMGQMDIIGYPDPVREVMQRYFLRHNGDRILH